MKIKVYAINRVAPKDANEEELFCELLNLPSLKYGYAEFLGSFSHAISKADLKKQKGVAQSYYCFNTGKFIKGTLLLNSSTKMFAVAE